MCITMWSFVSRLAREQPKEYDCNILRYFWIDLAQIKFSSAVESTRLERTFVAIFRWMFLNRTWNSPIEFDSSLQFVHGLWTTCWIAFVVAWRKYWWILYSSTQELEGTLPSSPIRMSKPALSKKNSARAKIELLLLKCYYADLKQVLLLRKKTLYHLF